MSVRAIGRKYKIPEKTLSDRIKGIVKGVGHMSGLKQVPKVLEEGKRFTLLLHFK